MKTDWIAGLLGPWSAELAPGSILLRLALSMALAAIIGCERSSKRHSAGLRTFILVSLAGTATMLIDQYLMELLPVTIPVLSAAAVIGITTISANSILFSSKNQIKGLTTSVGLWCCGIVGLALGAGLYTLALVLFLALLCSMSGLPALETHLKDRSNHFEVHLELKNKLDLPGFVSTVRALGIRIDDIESNPAYLNSGLSVFTVSFTVSSAELKQYKKHGEIIEAQRAGEHGRRRSAAAGRAGTGAPHRLPQGQGGQQRGCRRQHGGRFCGRVFAKPQLRAGAASGHGLRQRHGLQPWACHKGKNRRAAGAALIGEKE